MVNNEVIVWCASLDLPVTKYEELVKLLAPDELARANQFIAVKHRQRFIAARGTLRCLLSHYLQESPDKLMFRYQAHGKPELGGSLKQKLFFNLAHSSGLALYALCLNKELGIDVEHVAKSLPFQQIAQRFFSIEEWQVLEGLPAEKQSSVFFHCWTRKEAFVKAVGTGLGYPLANFAVTCALQQPAKILHINNDSRLAKCWKLYDLSPAEGYIGALAVKKPVNKLSCYKWDF